MRMVKGIIGELFVMLFCRRLKKRLDELYARYNSLPESDREGRQEIKEEAMRVISLEVGKR